MNSTVNDLRDGAIFAPDKDFVYVLIRKDMDLAQQLVQAAHAAFEAGLRWPQTAQDTASLVALQVRDKRALRRVQRKLSLANIDSVTFVEPDFGIGESAIATRPLSKAERAVLRGHPLWTLKSAFEGKKPGTAAGDAS